LQTRKKSDFPKSSTGAELSHDRGSKGAVPAVLKAACLLDVLAVAREPLSLAALTNQLRLPKSTVHALCATLMQTGLVRRFESGSYHLGMHVMDLSHALLARTNPTVEFAKLWDSLALLPEETIILSVLDRTDVVYVACRNGTRPLGLNFRIGMRLPANCTASGKALLSTLPSQQIAELARAGEFRALTRKSVTDPQPLMHQLAQVRKRGYSVDDEETRDGMICFGAPVFGSGASHAVAAVGVSLVKAALSTREKKLAIEAVQKLAMALSNRLGANPAHTNGNRG
jgi:IclR family transcriptional regulator, blcABC operon repressor